MFDDISVNCDTEDIAESIEMIREDPDDESC